MISQPIYCIVIVVCKLGSLNQSSSMGGGDYCTIYNVYTISVYYTVQCRMQITEENIYSWFEQLFLELMFTTFRHQ